MVEERGFGNKNRLRIKYGRLEEVTQDSVIFRVGLDGETMDGELYIRRGGLEGQPGVVADREGLGELVDKSIKEGGVESSGDGGINNGEGDRTIVIDKDFEADREARVSFPQNGGSQVRPADEDGIAFGVGARDVPGGIESPSGTGEGRRTLG